MRNVTVYSAFGIVSGVGHDDKMAGSLLRGVGKGQKGKLRNDEHLSNRSSLSQPRQGLHEDMVLTEPECCQ